MKPIAVIPARGGSKRIPGKNIKEFLGRPIISYVIENSIKSGLFDQVIVSTDDERIATIAKEWGARVPFLRSEKNSDDYATLVDVINEVDHSLSNENINTQTICVLLPTAVLTSWEDLTNSYHIFSNEKFDIVMPVVPFGYPVQRSLKIDSNNRIAMVEPMNIEKRSQDLEKRYHDAGQYYWLNLDAFRRQQQFFSDNTGAIILDELKVQDIDTDTDWKLAELKFKLLFEK